MAGVEKKRAHSLIPLQTNARCFGVCFGGLKTLVDAPCSLIAHQHVELPVITSSSLVETNTFSTYTRCHDLGYEASDFMCAVNNPINLYVTSGFLKVAVLPSKGNGGCTSRRLGWWGCFTIETRHDQNKLPSKTFRDHFTGEISIEQPPPISDSLKPLVGFPKFLTNPYDNDI